jgi:hypothetical protein
MVVYQCIQAVDLYGLEVDGIYRLSGTNSHVAKLKQMFNNGEHLDPGAQRNGTLIPRQTQWRLTSATPRISTTT